MGQAKQRGTYEQRKALGEAKAHQRHLDALAERETQARQRETQRILREATLTSEEREIVQARQRTIRNAHLMGIALAVALGGLK